jgi:hypothetical protein
MTQRLLLTSLLVVGFVAELATAETLTRTGPRMTVERIYNGSGSGTVSRELQNGATVDRSTSCAGYLWRAGCSSSANVQTQNGQEYSVERNTLAGRYRGRAVTSVTGSAGNTVVSPRRWRRW